MVFLNLHTQNHESRPIRLNLGELIRATAANSCTGKALTEAEVNAFRRRPEQAMLPCEGLRQAKDALTKAVSSSKRGAFQKQVSYQ